MRTPDATDGEWYERERASFIAWWESDGQKKFGATPTLAAGAGWLARAEAASTASETAMPSVTVEESMEKLSAGASRESIEMMWANYCSAQLSAEEFSNFIATELQLSMLNPPDASERAMTEYRRGLKAAWDAVNAGIKTGELQGHLHEWRNGMVLASNAISALPGFSWQPDEAAEIPQAAWEGVSATRRVEPDNVGDTDRWQDPRDLSGGQTDATRAKPDQTKPIEDIDEALAAIPTKAEIDEFFFNGTPPRWVHFGLEYRYKVKKLAEVGLTASATPMLNGATLTMVRREGGPDGPVVACSLRTEDGVIVNLGKPRYVHSSQQEKS